LRPTCPMPESNVGHFETRGVVQSSPIAPSLFQREGHWIGRRVGLDRRCTSPPMSALTCTDCRSSAAQPAPGMALRERPVPCEHFYCPIPSCGVSCSPRRALAGSLRACVALAFALPPRRLARTTTARLVAWPPTRRRLGPATSLHPDNTAAAVCRSIPSPTPPAPVAASSRGRADGRGPGHGDLAGSPRVPRRPASRFLTLPRSFVPGSLDRSGLPRGARRELPCAKLD
jgi:hypothetical protein